jgi:hypothetical protein
MNTQKLILIFFLSFGFFSACKKESNPDRCHASIYKYFKLDPEYNQNIPYSGNDTLKFIDTAGSILTFIGQGIDSNYVSIDKYNSGPACPPDYDNYQYFQYSFNEIYNKANMKIIHYTNRNGYDVSGFDVIFNQSKFPFADSDIKNDNSIFIIKQRSFNGKLYTNLFYNYMKGTTDSVFYNRTIGIISFKINGLSYYLKN